MNHPAPPALPRGIAHHADSSIGGLLLAEGKITAANAEAILRLQKESGLRFGEAARRLGLIDDIDIDQALARQFDYPYLRPGAGDFSTRLVAAREPFGRQAETLRTIRSQLMSRWFGQGHKSIVVASIDPGDGASVFVANLAVVFAQLGEQTLLVDGNLRTPAQHELFGLTGRQGLSDMLAGRAGMDAIARIAAFVDLSILGAGTLAPNPHELLSRASFATLHDHLETGHDVVLYDVAACATGADALAIGARAGGVLLVARKDRTGIDDIAAFSEQLAHSGIALVGAVLHDF